MTFQVQPPKIVSKKFELGPNGYRLKYQVEHASIGTQPPHHMAMLNNNRGGQMKLYKASNFARKSPNVVPSYINVSNRSQTLRVLNKPC